MNEEIEVTEVTELPSTELAPVAPTTLFRTDDPNEVLRQAQKIADLLAGVLKEKGMLAKISERDYVRVEGWLTLGSMLGVTPVNVWTRRLEDGWEARVEARTLDGRVIGSAEAMCLRAEENWKEAEEFALRSMAQTRATSKALASVLRFVVTLAGMEGTPAEEMAGVEERLASEKAKKFAYDLLGRAQLDDDQRAAVYGWSHDEEGNLTAAKASKIIEMLKTRGRNDPIPPHKITELLRMAGHYAGVEADIPADTEDLDDDRLPL
jgi:hypothetical protein